MDGWLPTLGENDDTLDAEAAAIRVSVRRGLFGEQAPLRIGRFDIVSTLGRGGMGVVYQAHDPQLDRSVAVKVLRPPAMAVDADPRRAQRLLREAQAIAKLSHPNVITVYEVDVVGDAVYMAMELIAGQTLRAWVKQSPRTWPEVVDIFVQAGRGVAAAHEAGLVHRDFKPDNIMVDANRHATVVDFGLARLTGLDISVDGDTLEVEHSSPDLLTVTGMVLGTPAYMAPEQRRSTLALAASDQYGMCVSLHEMVYGTRPVIAEDGTPPATYERTAPAALGRIIARGLAPDPGDRFESMQALVDALATLLVPRRRRWVLAATGIGVTAGAALLWQSGWAASAPSVCPPAAQRASTVWNEERQAALAERFADAQRGFAEDAWPRLASAVDERIAAWVTTSDATCHATRTEGTQPEDIRLWRSFCLESQLQRLDALLGALQSGDATALVQALPTLAALDRPQLCDAERAGRSAVQWPQDPATMQTLQELDLKLAVAAAGRDEIRLTEGIAQARDVAQQAAQLEFPPLVSKARRVEADLLIDAGRGGEAEAVLTTAIENAEAGHDDEGAAEAWISLVHVLAEELARLDDAKRMFALVNGSVTRAGSPGHLQGRWLQTQASVLDMAGDFDGAIALLQQALPIVSETHGAQHARVADVVHGLARAHQHRGDSRKSLQLARQALTIIEAGFGPRHPNTGSHLTSIGSAHGALGEYEAGLLAFERALAVWRDAFGPDHPRVGAAHNNLGSTYMLARDPDQALLHYRRAVEIDKVSLGAAHPHRVPALYGLAMVHMARDEHDQAVALLTEGLDVLERAWGMEHPDLSYVLTALADIEVERGNAADALARHLRVVELLTGSFGNDHRRLVPAYAGTAKAHAATGDHEAAIAAWEAAMRIVDLGRNEPVEGAEVRIDLAEALHDAGRSPQRVVQLAEAAHRIIAGAGPNFADRAREISDWLGTLPQ